MALALEGTYLVPWLYWWATALVYVGCAAPLWGALNGHWHQRWLVRVPIALLTLLFLSLWTFEIVLAKATMKGYSQHLDNDLRVYLINDSDYDFHHIDVRIATNLIFSDVHQMEPVCQGFSEYTDQGGPPAYATIESGGKEIIPLPAGPSIGNRVRVQCDELPKFSTAALVIHLSPMPELPTPSGVMIPRQTILNYSTVRGSYMALGRERPVSFHWGY